MIRKQLLKKLIHTIVGISFALNLLFAASVVFKIDIRKNMEKLKSKLASEAKDGADKPDIAGRWGVASPNLKETALTAEQKAAIKQLESIGYMAGSTPAPPKKHVTVYNEELAYKGLNLYASGHATEAILTDLQGNELHKWSYNFWDIWPNYEPPRSVAFHNHEFFRRVHLLAGGELLAIFEGIGLVKLDKDSNLLWVYDGKAHHDLFVDSDGKIYVLTRKAGINPKYNKENPILEDFVTILSGEGKELRSISVLKSLENSSYASILSRMRKKGDIFHTNTIEVLDGTLAHRSEAFRKGNVLISIRRLDLVCVVDMERESVVWALSGLWRSQHQPTILNDGTMLVFDNRGNNGKSRVIRFDPFSQEVIWVYSGTSKAPLYSFDCGSCEELPNGNILISESNNGRAFEVTPDKTIVWEFFNPHRAGANNELIADLFEAIRLGPDFPLNWLAN